MLIGTCQRLSKCKPFKIQIGDIVLETVKSAKLLGIHIDSCLIWSTHLGTVHLIFLGGGGLKKNNLAQWHSEKNNLSPIA